MLSDDEKPVLVIDNVSKYYPILKSPFDRFKYFLGNDVNLKKFNALSAVSFTVNRGETLGIIGSNGAGKSTLLSIISGILQPTTGSVTCNARVASILALGAGFDLRLTGKENIFLYGSLLGLSHSQITTRLDDIISFSELVDFIDMPVETYSSGMYARLAFSVIAHVDADVLIIDEALSVGDARFNLKCFEFLEKFKLSGTILFVSHSLDSIRKFCDRVIWLDKGVIVKEGSPKSVCDLYYASINRSSVSNVTAATLDPVMDSGEGSFSFNGNWIQAINSFGFNNASARHGDGRGKVISSRFSKVNGSNSSSFSSLEHVFFEFSVSINSFIDKPILGFIIKDSFGQPLIGGNSYYNYIDSSLSVCEGDVINAYFEFRLPILKVGDYSIVAAIGDGTLQNHVHVDWMHDSFIFNVSHSSIEGVITGVPLEKIDISIV